MDEFINCHLILCVINSNHNEDSCILPVYQLKVLIVNERALSIGSRETALYDFCFQKPTLINLHMFIVLRKSDLPLFIHHEEKCYHFFPLAMIFPSIIKKIWQGVAVTRTCAARGAIVLEMALTRNPLSLSRRSLLPRPHWLRGVGFLGAAILPFCKYLFE